MLNFKQKLTRITTIIFDIDGVLTDGKVFVMDSGEMLRNINSKDGYGLHIAVTKGYRIAVISGGQNGPIKDVLSRTGITDVFVGQHDKLACYLQYIEKHGLKDEEVLFMGDDLPDFEIMSRVGLAVCPADAAPEIKQICNYISLKNGGEGCVRDIIEQVMRSQGKWEILKW